MFSYGVSEWLSEKQTRPNLCFGIWRIIYYCIVVCTSFCILFCFFFWLSFLLFNSFFNCQLLRSYGRFVLDLLPSFFVCFSNRIIGRRGGRWLFVILLKITPEKQRFRKIREKLAWKVSYSYLSPSLSFYLSVCLSFCVFFIILLNWIPSIQYWRVKQFYLLG